MKRTTYTITITRDNKVVYQYDKYAWNSARRSIPERIKGLLNRDQCDYAEMIGEHLTKQDGKYVYGVQTWKVLPCNTPEPYRNEYLLMVKIESDAA